MRARRGGFAWGLWLLPLLLPCTAAGQRIADLPDAQAAAKPGAGEPALVLTASVASLERVSGWARELNAGELPFLSPSFIEQQISFIGPGGLATDRPLGVLFYADKQFDLERALTFVLPVTPGKAELKTFIDKGAQPVAGREDVVALEGVAFRRTKDQLIFGQLTDAVATVREDVLTGVYANDLGTAARIDLDAAALKRAMPDRYETWLSELANDTAKPDVAGPRALGELAAAALRRVTRVGLSVGRAGGDAGAGAARLGVRVEPAPRLVDPKPAKIRRPGLPAGTMVRSDFARPSSEFVERATDALEAWLTRDDRLGKLTAAQRDKLHALATDASKLLLEGDAGSLGVAVVASQPVVYWIAHRPGGAAELGPDVKAIAARAADLAKSARLPQPLASYASYPAAGTTVHRLTMLGDDGKPAFYLDALAQGDSVMFALAPGEGRHVERLLDLEPEGETTSPISGWIDLAALAEAGVLPDAPDAGDVDPKAAAELKAALAGHRLDWTATSADGVLAIDVIVPKALLQKLPALLQSIQ